MAVSRQLNASDTQTERGPRARTRKLMVETATRLMQEGLSPSVSEVAEAAGVSRATAYRYFPSQAALVHAVVVEALGPILEWRDDSDDAEARIRDLFEKALPRIAEFETTFKAALRVSLDQWAREQVGTLDDEPRFRRGRRMAVLNEALSPLKGRLTEAEFDRLAQSLSLLFGVEVFIVLKDIWGLSVAQSAQTAQWAACALVRTSIIEAEARGANESGHTR
jgi:AcrR family transcriptional regulator